MPAYLVFAQFFHILSELLCPGFFLCYPWVCSVYIYFLIIIFFTFCSSIILLFAYSMMIMCGPLSMLLIILIAVGCFSSYARMFSSGSVLVCFLLHLVHGTSSSASVHCSEVAIFLHSVHAFPYAGH